ncbi:DNA cytosine methyltransferase [Umezawaea beigongshangensis]|uniref:DNA cytosine methyltransferase n=1 Tax=Umezawaea beigongshangensis TaxID=2780383 RepID=UPI0027DBC403|nr:DNA cytosine methyltransferase [Umezawaea beigongshangensis]
MVDLFSGAGGASAGFHDHPRFSVVAAADAQMGKPSSQPGALGCNETYTRNIGIRPLEVDLGSVAGPELKDILQLPENPSVLIACPPCTGFSRMHSGNHLVDDPRNSLVSHVADFVAALSPSILFMENARELIMGRFSNHFSALREQLEEQGYEVYGDIHFLTRFGLPQMRERALVLAVKKPLKLRTLGDLWQGYGIDEKSTYVRRAIWSLPTIPAGKVHESDAMHVSPSFSQPTSLRRLQATPHDGGSWRDLVRSPEGSALMTPVMRQSAAKGKFGSFPDVYGRMWWDRPAPTIKRECSHVGNGRYSHPEQDRLCTVREMGLLQGFPSSYQFLGTLSNKYRHIGDAVPPLISRQIASVCEWILTGTRPDLAEAVLPETSLSPSDIVRSDFPVLNPDTLF